MTGFPALNLDSIESVSIAILVERLGRVAGARMRPTRSPGVVSLSPDWSR